MMSNELRDQKTELTKATDFFSRFRREMDDFISNFTGGIPDSPFTISLDDRGFAVDVAESNGHIEVTAELPGVESDNVNVVLKDGSLVISAEKEAEKKTEDKNWHRVERSYGSFRRIVPLGFVPDHDKLEAELKNGILRVTIPKPAVKKAEEKKIAIKSG